MVGSVMACVDFVESVGVSEGFMDCPSYCNPAPSFGWLSPRISFSKDFVETGEIESAESNFSCGIHRQVEEEEDQQEPGMQDTDNSNSNDFEFCLTLPDDPLSMLPADELFYQGKLMPLQCPSRSGPFTDQPLSFSCNDGGGTASSTVASTNTTTKPTTIQMICNNVDSLTVSPKAPRCSSRWKELLGLKKLQNHKQDILSLHSSQQPPKSSLATKTHLTPKSLKHLFRGSDSKLHSSSSSSSSSSVDLSSQPLLAHQPPRDSDADSGSARISVSSSSCAADLEDLPRFSLDSEKGNPNPIRAPLRVNVRKPRFPDVTRDGRGAARVGRSPYRNTDAKLSPRGSSVDSPRMNSSGKIVFQSQSLERSCSSPSSFSANMRSKDPHYRNCRQKENWRAMERSYSANVRVTPVLNVPVCSLRASKAGGGGGASTKGAMFGFTQLFSPQKKETNKPNKISSQTSVGTSSSNLHRREG